MRKELVKKAVELLDSGQVDRVLGWRSGEFCYDITPSVFKTAEDIEKNFVYDDFCGANMSKYLVAEAKNPGKILVFLKPCDTYSFAQLLKEHRVDRENVYVVGIPCDGMADIKKINNSGIDGVLSIEEDGDKFTFETLYGPREISKKLAMAERCLNCKSKKHVIYDELYSEEDGDVIESNRFAGVKYIESLSPEERYKFWQKELGRCIRCNACKEVCPACTCENCVFDNPKSGISNKAAASSFEESNYHIIRAFHVAGRCTDCGECSRVCPQNIPLHLLNRKFIKDINELYGEYQAGENMDEKYPLTNFTFDDCEPGEAVERGEGNE